MEGMMMNMPLRISNILEFAKTSYPEVEIISKMSSGEVHRTNYRDISIRSKKMANALLELKVSLGDRVATIAWNSYRHFELYFAISGIGAVCHTINPRLSNKQLIYIINHAKDKVIFVDLAFVQIIESVRDSLSQDIRIVVLTEKKYMPETSLKMECYEELLLNKPQIFKWPDFEENTAASLCYTSGTTGEPKGTLYTHRSTVLHAMMISISLSDALKEGKKILPVVPLFHVNAWGLPYAAPLTGAGLVFPGPKLDGESLYSLMESEEVYSAWGVPTVWLGLLQTISKKQKPPQGFGDVVIGGSSAPRSMIETFENLGINVCHAWGMTEMSPVGTQGNIPHSHNRLSLEEKIDLKSKHGRRLFGVELKIVGENGEIVPNDGKTQGNLYVQGHAITAGYFNNEAATRDAFDPDGWFSTGDIATIDPNGYLTIVDRSKDLIKSGGEWISSIDLENLAMSHPDIVNCSAIAAPHPLWGERPILIVIPVKDIKPKKTTIIDLLKTQFSKWQIPEDILFVDQLPLTATGKVSKLTLRNEYKTYFLEQETET